MSPAGDWLEHLEARLEQQLEAFLRANPGQEALLEQQEQAERQQRQRQQLQQAAALRSELLQLAAEIRQWRERAQRARAAGAIELVTRAEQHEAQLMDRGRRCWKTLERLMQTMAKTQPSSGDSQESLEQVWARFELEQELEALRRKGS